MFKRPTVFFKRLIFLVLLFAVFGSSSQVIYNAYANVSSISGTTFNVNSVNETNHSFAVGDMVVIIQMQDNVIGTNTTNVVSFGDIANAQSAGLYETKTITGLTRSSGTLTSLTFSTGILNTYNVNANSRVQIVSFRRLSSTAFTTTNNITGVAWNGTIGGVIALEVGTDFNVAHNISADGIGFRGGATTTNFSAVPCTAPSNTVYRTNDNQQGFKGEGIYRSSSTTFNNCRGKLINGGGGGNNHNGGGGGGGNYEQGGLGGIGWNGTSGGCTVNPGGGLGGISLKSLLSSRIYMGGGGGGGQQNDAQGTAGGDGGGIILLKANRIITTGTCGSPRRISADGETPANSGQDGSGGGGAGGTMVLLVNSYSVVSTCTLNIAVNGGNGSSAVHPDTHGGGGAGGQGYVVFSTSTPTTNVLVTANNGTAGCNNNTSPCTSLAGSASGVNGGGIQPNQGGSCTNSNLLVNPSFEFSVVPIAANNNLVGVSVWGGWTISPTANFNIIKTNGTVYGGGPDNAQDGTQYAEIEGASGNMDQRFRVPCTSTLNFSGRFSSREGPSGYVNWTASVQIVSSTGSVMGTSSTRLFSRSDGSLTPDQLWYQVTGSVVVAAGDYTYRAGMGDYGNFDNGFLCASNCNILPIKLADFYVFYDKFEGQVNINWQTRTEQNTSHFIVERSENGEEWREIKMVKAGKNSNITLNYSTIDSEKLNGTTYYRLKSVDLDGTYEYFNVVYVDPDKEAENVNIYPNPSEGNFHIISNKLIREIEIINSFGEKINRYSVDAFSHDFIINDQGFYYVKIIFDNSYLVKKIIVK